MAGLFLSFEGIDGSGKSTQARRLADVLRKAGHPVTLTREPGGSPGAEEIRRLVLEGATDRFADSTRIFQGITRGDLSAVVDQLHSLMIGVEPDLTLLFDLDPEVGLSRANARAGVELRFEDMGLAFQTKARAGFLALAARHPRFRVIDADGDADTVAARAWDMVVPHLPKV